MHQFPTAAQLSSWAGLCPANHEGAGIRKSVRTNRGNVWLKTTLTQSAWAATNRKRSELHLVTTLSSSLRKQARHRGTRTHAPQDHPRSSLSKDALPGRPSNHIGRPKGGTCSSTTHAASRSSATTPLPLSRAPILRTMSFTKKEWAGFGLCSCPSEKRTQRRFCSRTPPAAALLA